MMKILSLVALVLLPLTAHAGGLAVQVGAQVRTPTGLAMYSDDQDKDVPIALPTNRYTCTRRPVLHTPEGLVVLMITCVEGAKEAFVVGTACDSNQPDHNQSVVTVNISKDNKPINATLTVACRTVPVGTWL